MCLLECVCLNVVAGMLLLECVCWNAFAGMFFDVWSWRWTFGFVYCLIHVGISAFGLFPCLSSCVAFCVCPWVFPFGFQRLAFVVRLLAGVSAHVRPRFARSCSELQELQEL